MASAEVEFEHEARKLMFVDGELKWVAVGEVEPLTVGPDAGWEKAALACPYPECGFTARDGDDLMAHLIDGHPDEEDDDEPLR